MSVQFVQNFQENLQRNNERPKEMKTEIRQKQTDAGANMPLHRAYVSLCVTLIFAAILGTILYYELSGRAGKGEERGPERETRGFPAGVDGLMEGAVYYAAVSMMNVLHGETNYFAVLRRVMVVSRNHYVSATEPRFFILPFSLNPNRYYQFFRVEGGKWREEEYPPPLGEPLRGVRGKGESAPL